jgi:Transcriptional regulators
MEPDQSVAIAVKKLANQFNRYVARMKANMATRIPDIEDVTEQQGHIMGYLFEHYGKETVYQKDIEEDFNIRRSTAAIILKRMEKAGFITRVTSDTDARMKAIHLTEKSKKLHPIVKAEFLNAEKQATKGLSQKEIDLFLHIIGKIRHNIE